MLSNNETNSNVVETQQLQQQNNSTPSSEDLLEQKIESLEKEIKSLQKQGQLDRGIFRLGAICFISYLVATNWSAIASAFSTTGTATVAAGTAAAPIIGIVLGAVVGAAVLVGASYAAWRYRAEIKAGFKYAAEKTVEGAKHIGGKVKNGAVHAKDKVGEGVDSLKKRFKERDRIVFYNHAKEGDAIEKMTKFPKEDRKKAGKIKHELNAIFADKGDNSKLVKNILSEISLKIDLKIAEEAKSGLEKHTPEWQVQKDFIKHLGEKDLRVLIKQKALPSDVYFIDRVFSEHYDEIKEVIKECKESHLYSSVSNMFNKAEKRANRPSFKSLTRSISSSLSSLRRGNSEQSNSLPRSSSMSSVRTESTASSEAELLNPAEHKKVKQSSGFFSRFKRNEPLKEATDIKYQVFSEPDTLSRQVGESTFYVAPPKLPRSNLPNSIGTVSTDAVPGLGSDNFATVNPNRLRRSNSSSSLSDGSPQLTPAAPPKVPKSPTRSGSSDSGISSGPSTPTKEQSPSINFDSFGSIDSRGLSDPFIPKKPSPSVEDLSKARAELKKTGYLDKWVGQPSTKVDEVKPESTQVKTVG